MAPGRSVADDPERGAGGDARVSCFVSRGTPGVGFGAGLAVETGNAAATATCVWEAGSLGAVTEGVAAGVAQPASVQTAATVMQRWTRCARSVGAVGGDVYDDV